MDYSYLKKSLGALALLSIMLPQSAALALIPEAGGFPDVSREHYNYDAINYLKSKKVIQGYPDQTFRAQNGINRAEFLKILMESREIEPAGDGCFPDVNNQWYSGYVCKAKDLGIIAGYPDGKFHAGRTIAFTEASKITANLYELEVAAEAQGEEWYERYLEAMSTQDAIPPQVSDLGYSLSRAEMAEIVWRLETKPADRETNTIANIRAGIPTYVATADDLIAFPGCTELKDHLIENSRRSTYVEDIIDGGPAVDMAMPESSTAVSESAAPSPSPAAQGAKTASDDFSTTNIQVAGVDEADIVKNDGKYIYVMTGRTIRIVNAFPAEDMREVAIVEIEDEAFSPIDMYLDGDQLIILGNTYQWFGGPIPVEPRPAAANKQMASTVALSLAPYSYNSQMAVYVYDVSNHAEPELQKSVHLEGDLTTSRKIDDTLYIVSNYYQGYGVYNEETPAEAEFLLPKVQYSENPEILEPINDCGDVYYIPDTLETEMLTISAVSLDPNDKEIVSKTVIGTASSVYASPEHLYVAQNKADWWWRNGRYNEEVIIHKFDIAPETIEYEGKASVLGRVLNQFSMDEYQNHFRIATTYGDQWNEAYPSQNNLYILDKNLKQVGQIEGIAPGESIHSVRFMGDRTYMVTFKKVDPFYVIDTSEPKNPKILGELKIPGFSDYLHPYDENHIIGFGLDTVEADALTQEQQGRDFAWFQGVKVAMFDVTDLSNPIQLHQEIIGDRGTDTILRNTHKALLWAPEKGQNGKTLFALPITLSELTAEQKAEQNPDFPPYGEYAGQYSYVYDVSVEDGFEFRERITHQNTEQTAEDIYLGDWRKNINRALYIGNRLYTVSPGNVHAHTLDTLKEVKELELTKLKDDYGYRYWY